MDVKDFARIVTYWAEHNGGARATASDLYSLALASGVSPHAFAGKNLRGTLTSFGRQMQRYRNRTLYGHFLRTEQSAEGLVYWLDAPRYSNPPQPCELPMDKVTL